MHPQIEPPGPQGPPRRRALEIVGALVGTLGLVGMVLYAFPAGVAFMMGSDNCFPGDTALICTSKGQFLAMLLPLAGALPGLAVAVAGCWMWPRRHRPVWLLLGYAIAFGALFAARAVASGNTH